MRRVAMITTVVAVALVASVASAKRRASPRERAAVIGAAVAGHRINRAQAPCVRVFISTVNRNWASVNFVYPTPRACHEPANGMLLYHRLHGRWRYVTAGSSIFCPVRGVPNRVAHDLIGRQYSPNC